MDAKTGIYRWTSPSGKSYIGKTDTCKGYKWKYK